MKPRLLLARLCDLCHYSWKAARANRFPKILLIKKISFIKKQTYYLLKNKLADQLFASAFGFGK